MATYSTQSIPHAGQVPTVNAAASGLTDKVATGDNVFITVYNTSGTTVTCTLTTPGTVDSLAIADRSVAIVTGGVGTRIPIPDLYRNSSDSNLCTLTWSAFTNVGFSVESI
jgi:hypothetical protein